METTGAGESASRPASQASGRSEGSRSSAQARASDEVLRVTRQRARIAAEMKKQAASQAARQAALLAEQAAVQAEMTAQRADLEAAEEQLQAEVEHAQRAYEISAGSVAMSSSQKVREWNCSVGEMPVDAGADGSAGERAARAAEGVRPAGADANHAAAASSAQAWPASEPCRAVRVQDRDREQRDRDHRERDRRRRRAQCVNVGIGHRRRQGLQLHRQRVMLAHGLAGARDLIPRQREAEQADAEMIEGATIGNTTYRRVCQGVAP